MFLFIGLDEDLLHDLAIKLQKDWRRLGTWLHLPNPELSKLATGYADDSKRAHQVLVMWRKRQHASCDLLGELAKALRDTEYRETADWLVQGLLTFRNCRNEMIRSHFSFGVKSCVVQY